MGSFKIDMKQAEKAKKALDNFEAAAIADPKQQIIHILLSDLVPTPKNKDIYNMDDIEKLAGDIEETGFIDPLLVRPLPDNQYQIISGERRYLACKKINKEPVPAIVIDGKTELEYRRLLIAANNQRVKTPLALANEIKELKEIYAEMNRTMPEYLKAPIDINSQIARDFDVSKATVFRADRLNNLIPEIKELIESNEIPQSTAERFADMDEDTQLSIVSLIKEKAEKGEKLLLSEAKKMQQDYKAAQAEIQSKNEELTALQRQLAKAEKALEKKTTVEARPDEKAAAEIEALKKEIENKDTELSRIKEQQKNAVSNGIEADFVISSLQESVKRIIKENAQINVNILTSEQRRKYTQIMESLKGILK